MTNTTHDPAVRTECRDGVGIISLHRPDRLNALDGPTIAALRAAFDELGGRTDVTAVILRGEGKAFCAGIDLEQGITAPDSEDTAQALHVAMRHGAELIWAMRTIPQPVLAVVDGWAVGAGFALAAAADVRFIGAGARFSAPFLKLGMTVGDLGLTWFLPRIIGAGRTAQVFFDAGVIEAAQAAAWGLAGHISEDPMADAAAYARRLAAFPPYGVQTSKQLLNAGATAGLRDHLDAEARAQVIGALTLDAQRAMAAALAATKKAS